LTSLKRYLAAWRFARKEQPEVLYCHSMNQMPLAIFLARRLDIGLVMHLRTPSPVNSRRNRRRLSFASSFISVSESTMAAWNCVLPNLAECCDVIPNGVDLEQFSPPTLAGRDAARSLFGLPQTSSIAVFVGRVTPDKGVVDLIRAHKSLPLESRPLLVLAGAAYSKSDEDYEAHVRREAGEKTIFLGHQTEVVEVMRAADVLVLPSHREPFGRVVIESLACGVPVIGANVGGISEILAADFAELLFKAGDIAHLAELLAASTRSDFAPSRSERCREVAQRYDSNACHERVEAILQRVAEQGSR
jgi:glycosyltransferase involved in cell wall biosynthesis